LPKNPDELPIFWWTPGPPCNGCYVPFFVHGTQLPEIVSRAGTFGEGQTHVSAPTPPDQAAADEFSPDSYWWLFRRLMDAVKGGPVHSRPDAYPSRNRRVRAAFDALEQEFEAEVPEVVREAAQMREVNQVAAACILDGFSEQCVHKVMASLDELLRGLV
jgi:secernin